MVHSSDFVNRSLFCMRAFPSLHRLPEMVNSSDFIGTVFPLVPLTCRAFALLKHGLKP
jgi:hypothetical protein